MHMQTVFKKKFSTKISTTICHGVISLSMDKVQFQTVPGTILTTQLYGLTVSSQFPHSSKFSIKQTVQGCTAL